MPAPTPLELTQQQADLPQVRPWVRFFARTVDWYLFGFCAFLWVMLMPLAGASLLPVLGLPRTVWGGAVVGLVIAALVSAAVLLVVAEPLCFAMFGSTPGKSLLRVVVKNADGSRLGFQQAFKRLVNVVFTGEGLYIPFVFLITHWLSYRHLKRHGVTRWDQQLNLVVTHQAIGPVRAALASGILIPGFILINGLSAVFEYWVKKI